MLPCSSPAQRPPSHGYSNFFSRRTARLLTHRQLSSPEFYATCAASPPPPLSLLFGTRALASRVAVFTRLSLLRAVSGRSAAREVRARATELEMRKGMEGRTRSERLLLEENSAFGKFEVCESIACFVVAGSPPFSVRGGTTLVEGSSRSSCATGCVA